jgi:sec-independent protein translocase protein TatC
MTFWDHLDDLRNTLLRMAGVFFIVAMIMFFFKTFLFEKVILSPTTGDFFLYRALGTDISLKLQNIELSAQFFIHIKVTLICALVLSFPFLVFELWKFVAPALYDNEKKAVRGAFAFSSILFYLGVATAYCLIFPLMLNFFAHYQVSAQVENIFSLSSYISMLISTLLMFGIVFEFPTVIVILSSLGVVTKETLKGYRRHALCIIMILAAIITPSGDPFTLLICTAPMYLLYEFSILICRKG